MGTSLGIIFWSLSSKNEVLVLDFARLLSSVIDIQS